MKPLPLTLVIILAMLAGGGITYWTARRLPSPPAPANAPATVAPSFATPAPAAAPTREEAMEALPEIEAFDEAELNKAIEEAKSARARGALQPAATTPEEYARALGGFNYRLLELTTQFPERPDSDNPDAKIYDTRVEQLTREYANLSLDDALLANASEETPGQLAHLQAHLAAGSLGLDEIATAKTEAILQRIYQKLFPLDETAPDAEERMEKATQEAKNSLLEFLTADQRQRLELMGADQVLFGLPQPEQ